MPSIHDQLAQDAQQERDREARAIVLFLKDRLVALQNFERRFVESLDADRIFDGQLGWAEEIARRHGYQNAG